MANKYLTIAEIEALRGVTYSTSTAPTLAQMTQYLDNAEKQFDNEFGDYSTQVITNELVDGTKNEIFVSHKPIQSIQLIQERGVDLFNPSYTDLATDDYIITDAELGSIKLRLPVLGERRYKVNYTSGYDYADVPQDIKDVIYLLTLRQVFQDTLFATNGNVGVTTTIDVDVYKEVTKGGNPYTGLQAIDAEINKAKEKFKDNLKTYLI